MGLPFVKETILLVDKHENVYADLAVNTQRPWEVYNLVLACHEAGIMDKLIFGSGYPRCDPGECAEMLLGFNKLIANASLPNVHREKIRGIIERDIISALGIK